MAVDLAPELLAILACPNCHGPLAVDHDRDELVCTDPECGLAYPVRDQIPVLLIDEARRPGGSETEAAAGTSDPAEPADDPTPAGDTPDDPATGDERA